MNQNNLIYQRIRRNRLRTDSLEHNFRLGLEHTSQRRLTFGRYVGTTLGSIPEWYLKWMVKETPRESYWPRYAVYELAKRYDVEEDVIDQYIREEHL